MDPATITMLASVASSSSSPKSGAAGSGGASSNTEQNQLSGDSGHNTTGGGLVFNAPNPSSIYLNYALIGVVALAVLIYIKKEVL